MMAEEKPPTRWEDFRDEMLAGDPELRAEYEKLGPRFDALSAQIRARRTTKKRRAATGRSKKQ